MLSGAHLSLVGTICWQHLPLQLGLAALFIFDGWLAARRSNGVDETELWPCSALILDVACDRALAFAMCERVRMLIGCCAYVSVCVRATKRLIIIIQ